MYLIKTETLQDQCLEKKKKEFDHTGGRVLS